MKRWKLSYEDFRNRARWADYETAIEDMMEKTSTKHAPWHLVPANNKPFGRVAAFRILKDRLGEGVSLEPRPIDPDLLKEAKRALGLDPAEVAQALEPAPRRPRVRRGGRGMTAFAARGPSLLARAGEPIVSRRAAAG